MWIPPACKGRSVNDNGYGIYDLWDLGEFEQKGTRRTKWGDYEDLKRLQKVAKLNKLGILFNAVLNHKAGADQVEKCLAIECLNEDRTKTVGQPREIQGWLGFTFPGRGEKYSRMKWHWEHFTGTDRDEVTKSNKIFRIQGKGKRGWAHDVDLERGNYDYLMFADIDHSNPEVRAELKEWSVWVTQELDLDGFVFDAVKHYSRSFLKELCHHVTKETRKNLACIGIASTSLSILC